MIYSPASEPAGHALRPIANGPTGQKKEPGEAGSQKKEADETGRACMGFPQTSRGKDVYGFSPGPAATRPPPQKGGLSK